MSKHRSISTREMFMVTQPMKTNFRLAIPDHRSPSGPDGRGWNRLSINPMEPIDRCALLPKSRQAALDTLRGMAHYGVSTAYSECRNLNGDCATCLIATKERDPWRDCWQIREDHAGIVWLLGDKGFTGFGYYYKDWAALIRNIEVPMLRRMKDDAGFYWVAFSPEQDSTQEKVRI